MNIKKELENSLPTNLNFTEKEKASIRYQVRSSYTAKFKFKSVILAVFFITIAIFFVLSMTLPNLIEENALNDRIIGNTTHSSGETFEGFFHRKMKEMHQDEENFTYSLVHTEMNAVHKDDMIAVFKERNSNSEEKIYIAYIEKEGSQWEWKRTRGAEWDSPVKWSSMDKIPYIYSGAIRDNSIAEVYAGDEKAIIIDIENDKRFWYVISPVKDVQVKMVKKDGTEEVIKSLNFEER
ncbi:hypothetical protein WMO40_00035 [Bacillaceae bacterium CLA-AA-H227]|uniref:Uncharacterized protein n=1 Tax=Robertmurraya yapensis (ex Hitch et al 2024) TaxID=3133160 RepID=A0ACC6S774_9BACI